MMYDGGLSGDWGMVSILLKYHFCLTPLTSVHICTVLCRDKRQGASQAKRKQFNFDHDKLHRLAD
jgi:hypothetical protein